MIYKPYYCEFCNEIIVPDEYGVYVHKDVYHYEFYVYDTEPGTMHVVPLYRFESRH